MTFRSDRERPPSVIVFVTALSAFLLAAFVTFYPQEAFPWALIALPFLGPLYGLLALGIWSRSRIAWTVNVWVWGGLLWRSLDWFLSDRTGSLGPGLDFSHALLRTVTAVVLLNLLFAPSLFRWIWRKDRLTS